MTRARILAKPTRRESAQAIDRLRQNFAGSAAHDQDAARVVLREDLERRVAATLGRKRRTRDPAAGSESKEQQAVVRWWSGSAHRAGACLFYKLPSFALYAVPNGGRRDVIGAARLKAEGVRPGIPDLSLDVARGGYHGLKLELKYGRGKESDAQIEVLGYLKQQGYQTATCWSAAEAIKAIETYLNRGA